MHKGFQLLVYWKVRNSPEIDDDVNVVEKLAEQQVFLPGVGLEQESGRRSSAILACKREDIRII
jgi:hypothetical protein